MYRHFWLTLCYVQWHGSVYICFWKYAEVVSHICHINIACTMRNCAVTTYSNFMKSMILTKYIFQKALVIILINRHFKPHSKNIIKHCIMQYSMQIPCWHFYSLDSGFSLSRYHTNDLLSNRKLFWTLFICYHFFISCKDKNYSECIGNTRKDTRDSLYVN